MSFPTTPVFLTDTKGWEQARVHPAIAWLEKYTKAFDSRESWATPHSEWHTEDYVYTKATGETFCGAAAWNAAHKDYAPFKAMCNEPKWGCIWETKSGWEMVGEVILFADFAVEGREKKFEDLQGRRWDLGMPGMLRFEIVRDEGSKHEGIKLKRIQNFSDTRPVIMEMLKRGMIAPK
jgi:hypothetical protein